MSLFNEAVITAAKRHARAEFPKESCGLVINDVYEPCRNAAADPLKDFIVHPADHKRLFITGKIQAVIHSHPFVPATKDDKPVLWPTLSDMQGQMQMNIPWAIVPVSEDRYGELIVWGGDTPIAPMVGRKFVHGITDCYSLIRDTFRFGREALALQGIDWPYPPVTLPQIPRDNGWWNGENDQDHYADNFAKMGFVEVPFSKARAGDVYMVKIKSEKLNHGGVLLGNNLLMQHFNERLSVREPAGIWARSADLWIRYEGAFDAS